MSLTIWTVGHSNRSLAEFLGILGAAGVRHIADIRRYPGSRRHPQFSGPALAAALAEAGIGYSHHVALGGRRRPRPDSPNRALRNEQFRGYADHMATAEFRAALDDLIERARAAALAIMCAEAFPAHCHRSLTADALVLQGVHVVHLLGGGRERPHEPWPELRRGPDGEPTYPDAPLLA